MKGIFNLKSRTKNSIIWSSKLIIGAHSTNQKIKQPNVSTESERNTCMWQVLTYNVTLGMVKIHPA